MTVPPLSTTSEYDNIALYIKVWSPSLVSIIESDDYETYVDLSINFLYDFTGVTAYEETAGATNRAHRALTAALFVWFFNSPMVTNTQSSTQIGNIRINFNTSSSAGDVFWDRFMDLANKYNISVSTPAVWQMHMSQEYDRDDYEITRDVPSGF